MRGPDDLERLALLTALAGITTIFVASAALTPDKVDVGEVDEGIIGEAVRVEGVVRDYSRNSGTGFFKIEAGGETVKGVNFDSALGVEEGEKYVFTGRVDVYRGELEVIVRDAETAGSS